jgi:hypothetical protein
VLPREQREDHVRDALVERCRALHIKPPAPARMDRLVRSAFRTFEERWCAAVFERLEPATRQALDKLLVTGRAEDGTDAEVADRRRSVLNR